eukprot:5635578-Pyramimonas_sp.AAC.1
MARSERPHQPREEPRWTPGPIRCRRTSRGREWRSIGIFAQLGVRVSDIGFSPSFQDIEEESSGSR